MKKIIVSISAVILMASALVYANSNSATESTCKSASNCVCSTCSSECEQGCADCTCEADCCK